MPTTTIIVSVPTTVFAPITTTAQKVSIIGNNLLLEDGTDLLLEDGSQLLLE